MSTATIIKNLNTLAAAIVAYPEELFNLARYRSEDDCGTLYCSAGLAASMPFFQEQGLEYDPYGDVTVNGVFIAQNLKELDKMFGFDAFDGLFAIFYNGTQDKELIQNIKERNNTDFSVTHKELALERIAKQIEIVSQDAPN